MYILWKFSNVVEEVSSLYYVKTFKFKNKK